MIRLYAIVAAAASAVLFRLKPVDISSSEDTENVASRASWSSHFTDLYETAFVQNLISSLYGLYLRLTFFNSIIFLVEYVPAILYMYRLTRNIYETSRERLKVKQIELEDIQIQIKIMNTKLCLREDEFKKRADLLSLEKERFKRVRARVRHVIATDDALRCALKAVADFDEDVDIETRPQEENDFIMELLKGIRGDRIAISDRQLEKMDCGEHLETERASEHSAYSSISNMDVRQDCCVKIVKVTKVIKFAYLKHYIRQKKLRRAYKRAILKKKTECMTKLMEEWQEKLNTVINRRIPDYFDSYPEFAELTSHDAMGDYSKTRDSSSDIDLRNCNDGSYDEYRCMMNNTDAPYHRFEDAPETEVSRDHSQDVDNASFPPESGPRGLVMFPIQEETDSNMALEPSDGEEDYRDQVAI